VRVIGVSIAVAIVIVIVALSGALEFRRFRQLAPKPAA
jgi:Flp pilus assembly pilin Flp